MIAAQNALPAVWATRRSEERALPQMWWSGAAVRSSAEPTCGRRSPTLRSMRVSCFMAVDPVRAEETLAWPAKADEDLRAARVLIDTREPLLETAIFHCRQAAEKAFKAFLVWHDIPFRRTYSLEEIGEQCLQVDPGLTELMDAAAPLGEYAWRYRYPGEVEHLRPDEVTEALDVSSRVLLAVTERLDSDDDFVKSRPFDAE